MAFLTDRTLATGVTSNDLIHIVVTGDTSQNPAGSSFKATMGQVLDLINPTTILVELIIQRLVLSHFMMILVVLSM
jgi:hypothetical protein